MSGEGVIQAQRLIRAPLEFRLSAGGPRVGNRALIICPKCNAPAFIRDSEPQSEKVKHILAHCSNTGCGHTFLMELVFVHSIVPGLIDRPDLDLPVCPRDKVPHVLPPARDGPDDPDQLSMFAG